MKVVVIGILGIFNVEFVFLVVFRDGLCYVKKLVLYRSFDLVKKFFKFFLFLFLFMWNIKFSEILFFILNYVCGYFRYKNFYLVR